MQRMFRQAGWLLSALLCGVAHGEPTISEAELLAALIAGPILQAEDAAVEARIAADGALPALMENPELAVRHEDARGPAGARTSVIGGGITVSTGLSGAAARDAARLRGSAGVHHRSAHGLDDACTARGEILSLWAANARQTASAATVDRMARTLTALTARAEAGEGSGYDRDRAALAMTTHQLDAAEAAGSAAAWQARMSTWTGQPITAVRLEALSPLPALDDCRQAAATHPRVLALVKEREAAARQSDAATRSALPDLALSGGARWDAPPDGGAAAQGYEVGASIELPFFERERTARTEASAVYAAVSAETAAVQAGIVVAIEDAWTRAEALQSIPTPPDPVAIWDATMARYLAGEASVDVLLQVAHEVDEAAQTAVTLEAQHRRARLALECATGRFEDSALQEALEALQ